MHKLLVSVIEVLRESNRSVIVRLARGRTYEPAVWYEQNDRAHADGISSAAWARWVSSKAPPPRESRPSGLRPELTRPQIPLLRPSGLFAKRSAL
jgi:hypothetical protein